MARPKGSVNRRSKVDAEKIAASGLTPIEYLVSVYQSAEYPESMRIDAAKAAAPYLHPRLSNVEMAVTDESKPPRELSDSELERIAASSGQGTAKPKALPHKPARLQ